MPTSVAVAVVVRQRLLSHIGNVHQSVVARKKMNGYECSCL